MPSGHTSGRRRRGILIGVAAVSIALVLGAAWVGIRGVLAKSELENVAALSQDVSVALSGDDFTALDELVGTAAGHAETAASLTGDPIWRAAEILPFVGPNLTATRVVAASLDQTLGDAVRPVLTIANELRAPAPTTGGLIDVQLLVSAEPSVAEATEAVDSARADLDGIDADLLLAPIRDAVDKLSETIATAQPIVHAVADATRIVPTVLGADGPSTLLLMAQNNAEVRTGGGITGTFVEFSAENGALTLVGNTSSASFDEWDHSSVPVPESTTALYGDVMSRYVQNSSMTPDFTLTAALASEQWAAVTGRTPDAVMSVDPLVLKALLTATGTVTVDGVDLSADNVIDRLLVEPYRELEYDAQDALFAKAATAIFERIATGGFDPITLAGALVAPVEQGRVSLWTADPAVQEVVMTTALAGPAGRHLQADDGAYAVYLNDATGGKMDGYLQTTITTSVESCRSDGRADILVAVEITSTAPTDAGTALPLSVTGGGYWGTRPGDIATIVSVAAPVGTYFGGVRAADASVASPDVTDAGFPTSAATVTLAPGETQRIEFRFISASSDSPAPHVIHTPLLTDPTVVESGDACL